jgi:hypothetical protein
MSRIKEAQAIDFVTQKVIFIITDVYDKLYTKIAKTLKKNSFIVKKTRKRVHDEIDKKNISFLEIVNNKRSRSERSFALNVRQRRRLVRHAIKNKANRRKF